MPPQKTTQRKNDSTKTKTTVNSTPSLECSVKTIKFFFVNIVAQHVQRPTNNNNRNNAPKRPKNSAELKEYSFVELHGIAAENSDSIQRNEPIIIRIAFDRSGLHHRLVGGRSARSMHDLLTSVTLIYLGIKQFQTLNLKLDPMLRLRHDNSGLHIFSSLKDVGRYLQLDVSGAITSDASEPQQPVSFIRLKSLGGERIVQYQTKTKQSPNFVRGDNTEKDDPIHHIQLVHGLKNTKIQNNNNKTNNINNVIFLDVESILKKKKLYRQNFAVRSFEYKEVVMDYNRLNNKNDFARLNDQQREDNYEKFLLDEFVPLVLQIHDISGAPFSYILDSNLTRLNEHLVLQWLFDEMKVKYSLEDAKDQFVKALNAIGETEYTVYDEHQDRENDSSDRSESDIDEDEENEDQESNDNNNSEQLEQLLKQINNNSERQLTTFIYSLMGIFYGLCICFDLSSAYPQTVIDGDSKYQIEVLKPFSRNLLANVMRDLVDRRNRVKEQNKDKKGINAEEQVLKMLANSLLGGISSKYSVFDCRETYKQIRMSVRKLIKEDILGSCEDGTTNSASPVPTVFRQQPNLHISSATDSFTIYFPACDIETRRKIIIELAPELARVVKEKLNRKLQMESSFELLLLRKKNQMVGVTYEEATSQQQQQSRRQLVTKGSWLFFGEKEPPAVRAASCAMLSSLLTSFCTHASGGVNLNNNNNINIKDSAQLHQFLAIQRARFRDHIIANFHQHFYTNALKPTLDYLDKLEGKPVIVEEDLRHLSESTTKIKFLKTTNPKYDKKDDWKFKGDRELVISNHLTFTNNNYSTPTAHIPKHCLLTLTNTVGCLQNQRGRMYQYQFDRGEFETIKLRKQLYEDVLERLDDCLSVGRPKTKSERRSWTPAPLSAVHFHPFTEPNNKLYDFLDRTARFNNFSELREGHPFASLPSKIAIMINDLAVDGLRPAQLPHRHHLLPFVIQCPLVGCNSWQIYTGANVCNNERCRRCDGIAQMFVFQDAFRRYIYMLMRVENGETTLYTDLQQSSSQNAQTHPHALFLKHIEYFAPSSVREILRPPATPTRKQLEERRNYIRACLFYVGALLGMPFYCASKDTNQTYNFFAAMRKINSNNNNNHEDYSLEWTQPKQNAQVVSLHRYLFATGIGGISDANFIQNNTITLVSLEPAIRIICGTFKKYNFAGFSWLIEDLETLLQYRQDSRFIASGSSQFSFHILIYFLHLRFVVPADTEEALKQYVPQLEQKLFTSLSFIINLLTTTYVFTSSPPLSHSMTRHQFHRQFVHNELRWLTRAIKFQTSRDNLHLHRHDPPMNTESIDLQAQGHHQHTTQDASIPCNFDNKQYRKWHGEACNIVAKHEIMDSGGNISTSSLKVYAGRDDHVGGTLYCCKYDDNNQQSLSSDSSPQRASAVDEWSTMRSNFEEVLTHSIDQLQVRAPWRNEPLLQCLLQSSAVVVAEIWYNKSREVSERERKVVPLLDRNRTYTLGEKILKMTEAGSPCMRKFARNARDRLTKNTKNKNRSEYWKNEQRMFGATVLKGLAYDAHLDASVEFANLRNNSVQHDFEDLVKQGKYCATCKKGAEIGFCAFSNDTEEEFRDSLVGLHNIQVDGAVAAWKRLPKGNSNGVIGRQLMACQLAQNCLKHKTAGELLDRAAKTSLSALGDLSRCTPVDVVEEYLKERKNETRKIDIYKIKNNNIIQNNINASSPTNNQNLPRGIVVSSSNQNNNNQQREQTDNAKHYQPHHQPNQTPNPTSTINQRIRLSESVTIDKYFRWLFVNHNRCTLYDANNNPYQGSLCMNLCYFHSAFLVYFYHDVDLKNELREQMRSCENAGMYLTLEVDRIKQEFLSIFETTCIPGEIGRNNNIPISDPKKRLPEIWRSGYLNSIFLPQQPTSTAFQYDAFLGRVRAMKSTIQDRVSQRLWWIGDQLQNKECNMPHHDGVDVHRILLHEFNLIYDIHKLLSDLETGAVGLFSSLERWIGENGNNNNNKTLNDFFDRFFNRRTGDDTLPPPRFPLITAGSMVFVSLEIHTTMKELFISNDDENDSNTCNTIIYQQQSEDENERNWQVSESHLQWNQFKEENENSLIVESIWSALFQNPHLLRWTLKQHHDAATSRNLRSNDKITEKELADQLKDTTFKQKSSYSHLAKKTLFVQLDRTYFGKNGQFLYRNVVEDGKVVRKEFSQYSPFCSRNLVMLCRFPSNNMIAVFVDDSGQLQIYHYEMVSVACHCDKLSKSQTHFVACVKRPNEDLWDFYNDLNERCGPEPTNQRSTGNRRPTTFTLAQVFEYVSSTACLVRYERNENRHEQLNSRFGGKTYKEILDILQQENKKSSDDFKEHLIGLETEKYKNFEIRTVYESVIAREDCVARFNEGWLQNIYPPSALHRHNNNLGSDAAAGNNGNLETNSNQQHNQQHQQILQQQSAEVDVDADLWTLGETTKWSVVEQRAKEQKIQQQKTEGKTTTTTTKTENSNNNNNLPARRSRSNDAKKKKPKLTNLELQVLKLEKNLESMKRKEMRALACTKKGNKLSKDDPAYFDRKGKIYSDGDEESSNEDGEDDVEESDDSIVVSDEEENSIEADTDFSSPSNSSSTHRTDDSSSVVDDDSNDDHGDDVLGDSDSDSRDGDSDDRDDATSKNKKNNKKQNKNSVKSNAAVPLVVEKSNKSINKKNTNQKNNTVKRATAVRKTKTTVGKKRILQQKTNLDSAEKQLLLPRSIVGDDDDDDDDLTLEEILASSKTTLAAKKPKKQ